LLVFSWDYILFGELLHHNNSVLNSDAVAMNAVLQNVSKNQTMEWGYVFRGVSAKAGFSRQIITCRILLQCLLLLIVKVGRGQPLLLKVKGTVEVFYK
tara:strand:- start:406 stop:699 length:294 start_codon:yes stop_codon:yes gene_type:complete